MRAADLDLIFVSDPGPLSSDHWQSRWRARLSSARFAGAGGGGSVDAAAVVESAAEARRPIFFIAHSIGAIVVAEAAPALVGYDVRGAFLVAPPSARALATLDGGSWGEPPRARLPFRAALVASRADPWSSFAESSALAADWGADLIDAGEAGRLDAASGHGPWPEGLLRLAAILKRL